MKQIVTSLVLLGLLAGCTALPLRAVPPPALAADRQILITVPQAAALYAGAPRTRLLHGWQQYGPSASTAHLIENISRDYALTTVDGWSITALGVYCAVLEVPEDFSVTTVLAELSRDSRIASAQHMQLFQTQAQLPNDPYYAMQTALQMMEFDAAHQLANGAGVAVAIIDTGVDAQHQDLAGRVQVERNFVTAKSDMPAERHGTAIAGVVAAVAGNGVGIVGAAPAVDVLALRACWQTTEGDAALCSSFTLAKALDYALDRGVDVINLSLAGPADPLLQQLTEAAIARGIVVVGAAPAGISAQGFPAGVEGVIAVRSLDEMGGDMLHAPGKDILTLAPANNYAFLSGDSLATALVTGVVALLLDAEPALTPSRIAQVLHGATRPAANGAPVLDACQALSSVRTTVCGSLPIAQNPIVKNRDAALLP